MLNENGILAGVKVDIGLSTIEGTDENYTMGLDGLAKRAEEYYNMGCRFAKWRAVLKIGPDTPSQ